MAFRAQGILAEWFAETFNGYAVVEEILETVGTTRIQVVRQNPERFSLLFINTGSDFITISPSTKIASGKGIRLGPNGGLAVFLLQEDAPAPAMPWWAVADSAGQDLYMLTSIREGRIRTPEG